MSEDPMDDRSENLQVMSHSEPGTLSGGCIIKKMVGKWGPYRYHVKRVGKKQTWTYLGKSSELVRERVGNSKPDEGVFV